jgi:hypothetical protein
LRITRSSWLETGSRSRASQVTVAPCAPPVTAIWPLSLPESTSMAVIGPPTSSTSPAVETRVTSAALSQIPLEQRLVSA